MPLSITDVFTDLSYRPQLGIMNRNAEFRVMKSDDNNMGSYGYKSPIDVIPGRTVTRLLWRPSRTPTK